MNYAAIDIHSHVQFIAYEHDREEALTRAREAKVGLINVGTQADTSKAAVDLAQGREGVWATIGLHPIHTAKSYHDTLELGGDEGKSFTSRGEVFDYDFYKKLGTDSKVVGVGECGLDYYRLEENTKELQKKVFTEQIKLANELDKPLMLHIRTGKHAGGEAAYDDALELLKEHATVKGDVHFFAGTWNVAKKFIDFGFTISFTGVLTFTHDYDEVVKNTPLDMILTETDAPYITPVPHRGKRNEPIYVSEVVRRISELKGLPYDSVAETTVSSARRVFKLDANR